MKNKLFILVTACFFSGLAYPELSKAEKSTLPFVKTKELTAEEKIEAEALLKRLDEIKALDKSEMTPAEKKEMRNEVKQIRSELRNTGGGIYLSAGAVIIIILLLIILL